MLMATDLGAARRFYSDKVGFTVVAETVEGIADVGFAWAWFVDPGGNTIGLLQFKNKGAG
jgi:catechol 2,3-dioxygenase-like lactoylglutathione lyase family enzyme